MAFNVDNITDYIKRENGALTRTLFRGDNTGLYARHIMNVKGSTVVPYIGEGAVLQKGTCVDPSGTTPLAEVKITVEPLSYVEDLCTDDLQTKLNSLAPGSHTEGDMESEFEEVLVREKVASISKTLAMTYWKGDTESGSYQYFDGFIKKIDAASPVDGNTSSATELTKANIRSLVENMIFAANPDVVESETFVVYLGTDSFMKYVAALKDANLYHFAPEHKSYVMDIDGFNGKLVGVRGLNGTDRMFASDANNFIIGSDVPEEEEILEVIYDKFSDKTRLRAKFKAGVQIMNDGEIVEFTVSA